MIPSDPEHFFIQERDGLRLITPKAATVFADHAWTAENIHYRSRLETPTGETVSQGFKKFMNLGQGPDGLRVDVVNACVRGDAVAQLKWTEVYSCVLSIRDECYYGPVEQSG